jgi:hypothetical protein
MAQERSAKARPVPGRRSGLPTIVRSSSPKQGANRPSPLFSGPESCRPLLESDRLVTAQSRGRWLGPFVSEKHSVGAEKRHSRMETALPHGKAGTEPPMLDQSPTSILLSIPPTTRSAPSGYSCAAPRPPLGPDRPGPPPSTAREQFRRIARIGDTDSAANPLGAVDVSDVAEMLEPLLRPNDTVAQGPGDSTLLVVCNRVACAADGETIAATLVSKLLPVVCRVRSTYSAADRDADLVRARAFRHWVLDQKRRADASHN